MPTVRFTEIEHGYEYHATDFLHSIGLQPELKDQNQTLHNDDSLFAVLGMTASLPDQLRKQDELVCKITREASSVRFVVGDYTWAAKVRLGRSDADSKGPLAALPNEIQVLSLEDELSQEKRTTKFLTARFAKSRSWKRPSERIETLSRWHGESWSFKHSAEDADKMAAIFSEEREWFYPRDLSALAVFKELRTLHVLGCSQLSDISSLTKLTHLRSLAFHRCKSIADLTVVANLKELESLDLSWCSGISDASAIEGCCKLKFLNLSECRALEKVTLPDRACLETLDLSGCVKLTHLLAPKKQTNLKWCDLGSCEALEDFSLLSGARNLAWLSLLNCRAVHSLEPVASCLGLSCLDLGLCRSLRDVSALKKLQNIVALSLYRCEGVATVEPLAGLLRLISLDLRGCQHIQSVEALSGLSELKHILFTSRRIRSIEPLRFIRNLLEVDDFNPPEVAEVLAHTAAIRRDAGFILEHASSWLREASGWREAVPHILDRFAATLATAFSLLGESEVELLYESFLVSHPEFTSEPWKAWFGGTLKESGFDLYRRRVERVPVAQMLTSAIGGACATLPIYDHSEWSRRWLAHLEKERLRDAKTLLAVAPEICLAYARAGEKDALARWLECFTDRSDPGALDPVHAALGKLRLSSGDCDGAEAHVFAIRSPTSRDPLLLDLVSALASSHQNSASAALLLIEEPSLRSRAAKILAIHPPLSETTIHRLVVAMGDSPQALADLIASIPAASDSELLSEISQRLQPERKAILRSVAAELHNYSNRLLAEADNAD